jgi:hypothetical protein
MTALTFKQFSGSNPRLAEHLIGGSSAAEALDCRLWHGTLEAWREPLQVREVAEGTKTVAMFGCCWLDFPACVDIAYGAVNCKKIYTTGDQEWPAVVSFDDDCVPTIRRLGIPCADTAPSVLVGAPTGVPKDTEGRSYAYQFVNGDGERGALSKASTSELIQDGQSVVVSGWEVPDASWGITKVRIYRAVSGFQSGKETGNLFDTNWMLVGEAGIGDASFTDTKYNDELQESAEEDVAPPPPVNLRGIVDVKTINALAGYVGNRVYFSENNSYHQWPYFIDLDDNVCGLIESNGVLYAATDGHPYAIAAAVDCKNAGCRVAVRGPMAYPMVGCGNRRMASTPQGAVYPSHDGLILLAGRGEPQVLTHPLYAPDDWQQLAPESATPVAFGGKLFVFARRGSFVLTMPSGSETGWPMDAHSTLSDTDVIDAFVTRTGDFYLLKGTNVVQWDRGAALRAYRWVSPESVTPVPVGFGAGHIHHKHGAESVTIRVDGRTVLSRSLLSSRPFRLPQWAFGTRWQVTLEGTGVVSLFSLATSMRELGA